MCHAVHTQMTPWLTAELNINVYMHTIHVFLKNWVRTLQGLHDMSKSLHSRLHAIFIILNICIIVIYLLPFFPCTAQYLF